MDELMMRIRFPVRRLAPARDDDASAIQWAVWPDGAAADECMTPVTGQKTPAL